MAKIAENSPTTIEVETYSALTTLGIPFEPQKRIGRFVVDAYLPDSRTAIEVMGDYFHANPAVYPIPQPGMQMYNRARDLQRAETLKAGGYRLILLWEKDIRARGSLSLLKEALTTT